MLVSKQAQGVAFAIHLRRMEVLFRILLFLRPVVGTAVIACGILSLRVCAELAATYFLSPAVTAISQMPVTADASFWAWFTGDSNPIRMLRWSLLALATSQLLLGGLVYLRSVWETKLSMHAVFYMRASLYDRLQRLDFSFHDRFSAGQLINRVLGDLQTVRSFLNLSVLSSFDILLSIGGYLGLLFFRSPWLALGAMVPIPLWWYIIRWYGGHAQPLYERQQRQADRVTQALSENILGVQVVKVFGAQAHEIEKYQKLNDGLLRRSVALIRLQARFTPFLRVIAVGSHIALFLFCVFLIRLGRLQVGDLVILGVAMNTILTKLQQVNQVVEGYQKAAVSAKRLFEVLDRPNEIAAEAHKKLSLVSGEIEFRNVAFGYEPSRPVLKDVSVIIPGGKTTALVGPTGAGKTTLASLVGRFYDPQSGQVLIDGTDIRTVDLKDLRHHVGYVFQETFLFSESIANNIRYGRPDISLTMVHQAAKVAAADEFISKLPRGYDTPLGGQGLQLSGGQRQRIALARALVYDPQILILDDATAALDPQTDSRIQSALPGVLLGRTVLIIAHRFTTLYHADQIIVLDRGAIVEQGRHADLILRNFQYREMIRQQLCEERESVMGSVS